NRQVGQIAVPAVVVEPVADHEIVRDHEAHVVDVHVDLPAGHLVQQDTQGEAPGVAGRHVAPQVADGPARVDDVLHDDHVPALDGDGQVGGQPHHPRGPRARPVGGHGHEVHGAGQRDGAEQIGGEEDRALQHTDQERRAPLVVATDGATQIADAGGDLVPRDQDAAKTPVHQEGAYLSVTNTLS